MNKIIELALLAQTTSAPAGKGTLPPQVMWIGIILIIFVIYMIMISPQKKEKKKREQMLSAIKKNDRVMTIGGIIGAVVSVNDNEVVIKIDESTNVKMSVRRNAIQTVLAEEEGAATTK